MYKKSFKARKTSNQQCVSDTLSRNENFSSFASLNHLPVSNGENLNTVVAPKKTVPRQIGIPSSSSSITTRSSKRKSCFDDIDFSDLKLETNLPSFANASKSFNVSHNDSDIPLNEAMNKTSNRSKRNAKNAQDLNLSDVDFDEDLISDQNRLRTLNLSEEDKRKIIAVVKKDAKVYKSGNSKDEFSELLNDDLDIDDHYFSNIKTQFNSNISYPRVNGFSTANGIAIKLSEEQLRNARQRFKNAEASLIQEIAGCLWDNNNANQN